MLIITFIINTPNVSPIIRMFIIYQQILTNITRLDIDDLFSHLWI